MDSTTPMTNHNKGRVRVLCMSGVWPHITANREAANVICHQIVKHLALDGRFEVIFGVINHDEPRWPEAAIGDREELERLGVVFHQAVVLPRASERRGSRARAALAVLKPQPERLIPGAADASALLPLITRSSPDVLLTIWSELATAAASSLPIPKMAYYGNPAHKLAAAQVEFVRRFGDASPRRRAVANRLVGLAQVQMVRRAHVQVMRRYDAVGDVAHNDAQFYAESGVHSTYLPNMWPAPPRKEWWRERDQREQVAPLKIVGNVGNLSATGNTLGLHLIGTEIVPRLIDRLGAGRFEVHLFGGGQPVPAVRQALQDPHIRIRGFVPDLDEEILTSPIFLVANNSDQFRVGHTRFLHGWSLGSCTVTFAGSKEAMPELVHGENVLLAHDVDDLVQLVADAGNDQALRRRLGEGGMRTLQDSFRPSHVVDRIAASLAGLAGIGRQSHAATPEVAT